MLAPLHPVRDLRLSGQVIYTGRSSMEVAVKMEAMESDGTEETIMLGTELHLAVHLSLSIICLRPVLYGLQRCKYPTRKGGELPYYLHPRGESSFCYGRRSVPVSRSGVDQL